MKVIFFKIILLLWVAFTAASCTKDKAPCDPNDKESPCYVGPNGNGNGNGSGNPDPGKPDDDTNNSACRYTITIEGQTTQSNQFGQDNIIFASSLDPEGKGGITLSAIQTKSNGEAYPAFELGCNTTEHFNKHTAVGTTYEVNSFLAIELHLPNLGDYSYHMDHNATPREGVLTVTVLENTEKQIRSEVAGTIRKKKAG